MAAIGPVRTSFIVCFYTSLHLWSPRDTFIDEFINCLLKSLYAVHEYYIR